MRAILCRHRVHYEHVRFSGYVDIILAHQPPYLPNMSPCQIHKFHKVERSPSWKAEGDAPCILEAVQEDKTGLLLSDLKVAVAWKLSEFGDKPNLNQFVYFCFDSQKCLIKFCKCTETMSFLHSVTISHIRPVQSP